IYMRGTVTATWSAGWNTVATGLPAEMRPAIRVVRQAPSTSEQGLYFRMGNDGVLGFNKPTAGTRTGDLSAIVYPADYHSAHFRSPPRMTVGAFSMPDTRPRWPRLSFPHRGLTRTKSSGLNAALTRPCLGR